MSAPKAVVFDLFGTLVTYPRGASHVRAMAARLGVEHDRLGAIWRRFRPQRDAGELTAEDLLSVCSAELDLTWTEPQIKAACADLTAFYRRVLTPRSGALGTLAELRERDLLLALISDASFEVARLWSETELAPFFATAVFSSEEHKRKPDPALYRVVCERLSVTASDCLYVGNGDGDELSGALAAGMRALLFTDSREDPGQEAAKWTGTRITALAEVLDYVAAA